MAEGRVIRLAGGRQGRRHDPPRAALARPLAAAFFLSGFAALIYELLWFRLLGHVFGSTATAASTLLAAWLFGLGLGAWLFGRWSDRLPAQRIVVVYVAVEMAIGLYGALSHLLLAGGATLYEWSYAWAATSAARLLFTRFAISFVLVAVPTTLMGGTLPLMVHLLRARDVDCGRATGRAYAINTAGAAAGTLLLPAWLLPGLGIAASLAIAAVANLGAAASALLHRRALAPANASATKSEADSRSTVVEFSTSPIPAALLLFGFLLSSFAALALETVWTRHLSLFFGAQTFTFAFVLFGYLVGLFLGGALYARLVAKGRRPSALLGGGLLLAALAVALPLPFLDELPIPQIELLIGLGISHGNFLLTSGIVIVALVLPPALGFGLVFPAVVDLLARAGRSVGRAVGVAYVVNALGTTGGALAAGFLLVPRLGTQRTLEISVLLLAVALALARAAFREGRAATRWAARIAAPALLLIVLVLPRWDWSLAHGEYSKDPLAFLDRYQRGALWPTIRGTQLSYFKEGTEATVSVCDSGGGTRSLFINGKPDASNLEEDMVAQRLLACVPGLFHPAPKRALVIGLGSGTTVATLERFPLESIDAAEISPEVGEAAALCFADVNDRFGDDPRVRLILDDGRNFLHLRPDGSYDLIISEPSNPWMAGVSALFTDEFFGEVKRKLRPGGVVCQWFHYYNMSIDHIRLLARTFLRHFPQACLFVLRGERPTGDLLLIGANGPLRLARLPDDPTLPDAVRAALQEVKNPGVQQLFAGLVASPESLAAFAGAGPINGDDRPILEFEAPADRFRADVFATLGALLTASDRLRIAAGDGVTIHPGRSGDVERWRGISVLTRTRRGSDELSRFVLLGTEFESEGTTVELDQLAGALHSRDDEGEVTLALAGPGAAERPAVTVMGHAGHAAAADAGEQRSVAIGWRCPLHDRVYFAVRRAPRRSAPEAAAMVAELVDRFPCDHVSR
jgi:spermidine synthase